MKGLGSIKTFDPIGKWIQWHQVRTKPDPFGIIDTYLACAKFLDCLDDVEDWGCGTSYAKQYFKHAKYVGVDGSPSKWCDVVDDLRTRNSTPDGILMRHVLEHNPEWEQVLNNALRSFKRRMALVMFLKFCDRTVLIENLNGDHIPCIAFKKSDITDLLSAFCVTEQSFERPPNQCETVFLIERE